MYPTGLNFYAATMPKSGRSRALTPKASIVGSVHWSMRHAMNGTDI